MRGEKSEMLERLLQKAAQGIQNLAGKRIGLTALAIGAGLLILLSQTYLQTPGKSRVKNHSQPQGPKQSAQSDPSPQINPQTQLPLNPSFESIDPIRIETTWKVVSIRCSRSPERQRLRISIRVMVFWID